MLIFTPTITDPHSIEIKRVRTESENPEHIGYIHRDSWEKEPYVITSNKYNHLSLEEMRQCVAKMESLVGICVGSGI